MRRSVNGSIGARVARFELEVRHVRHVRHVCPPRVAVGMNLREGPALLWRSVFGPWRICCHFEHLLIQSVCYTEKLKMCGMFGTVPDAQFRGRKAVCKICMKLVTNLLPNVRKDCSYKLPTASWTEQCRKSVGAIRCPWEWQDASNEWDQIALSIPFFSISLSVHFHNLAASLSSKACLLGFFSTATGTKYFPECSTCTSAPASAHNEL